MESKLRKTTVLYPAELSQKPVTARFKKMEWYLWGTGRPAPITRKNVKQRKGPGAERVPSNE